MEKIIIIDDEECILRALHAVFRNEGYEVVTYTDGLPIIRNDFESPDLFIIDHQMTEVNGLEICKFLKEQPSTKHVPVLIISATPDILSRAMEAGADAFLEKPFHLQKLLNTASRLIAG